MSIWPDQSGNKLNQTYIRGFLDISGGDINIRNNGNIFVGNNTTINGNIIVGNNATLNKNVTIGQSTIPYLLYDFEIIDICSNVNNVIQCIPAPNLFQGNTNNLISNQKDSLTFKNGYYDVSASSFIGTNYVYNAFNGSNGTIFWQSNPNYNNGVYTGNTTTNYANNTLTLSGEWIQIKFPNTMAMILTKYSFLCNTPTKGPKNHSIFGSNTGLSWTLIANNPMNLLNSPYSSTKVTTFTINNSQPYLYYRLVINSIWPGSSVNAAIQQWNLYGIPYANNRAISTSLLYNYSSSLYDSLFSSSSSTMIDSTSSITRNSSLKLDGVKNSIVIPYLPVTIDGLTFSVWIQPNFSPSISNIYYTIFEFLNATNSISIILNTSNGNISWQIFNQTSVVIPNINITPLVWTHIAWTITYDSGNNSVWQFYLNGVNVYSLTSQRYPTPGDFFINYIGRSTYSVTNSANYQDFYGNIDNFRVYNTLLTSFQIGSLYNIRELLTINNSLYYQYNDTFLGNKLSVLGDTSLNNNVTIYGITASTSSNTGALIVSGGVGIGGNINISSSTASTSSTTGAFIISGGVGIGGNINIASSTASTSITTGALTISGGIGMGGNLYVGSTTISSSTTTGSMVVSGGAGIAGNTNIGGNVKITTNTITTDLNTGSFINSGGAAISGNVHIGSNAIIYATTASTSTTTGALTISGGVGISGNINIGGSINSSSISSPQFNSSNNILITDNSPNYYYLGRLSGNTFQIIIVSGAVNATINTIAETCTISGIIFSDGTITASYYTNGKNVIIDNIYVNRIGSTSNYDIYIHTNTNYSIQCAFNIYNVNGTWTVNPTINTSISSPPTGTWKTLNNFLQITSNANSTTTTNGAFIVLGGAGIGGNVNIGSALNVTGGATIGTNVIISGTTESYSTNTGTLTISGGMGVAGNTNIGGNIIIYATTSSTSKTTGALTISGGIGMGGNLYVGSTSISTSTTNGSLVVSGGVGIAGNTNIGGNVSTNGSILVSGNAGITGNINIGGNGIINGLMNCSGGLITPSYRIITNLALTPNTRLHNSYILFSSTVTTDINQYLPVIQNNTSSSIYLNNISTVNQTINCSSTNVFYGSGFESNNLILPNGYSIKFISDGSNWFVDTYKFNGSRLVDTNTDQNIYGNNTFYGTTYFNIISTNKITDNGLITDVNTLNAKTSIISNGTLSAIGITDTGTQTTIKRLSATSIVNSGTLITSGITDISNTIIGTSTVNTLLVNSLTKINGGISNQVFNLTGAAITSSPSFYGSTIIFNTSISTNIQQRIPIASISGGYNSTIFVINNSSSVQWLRIDDNTNFRGQQISNIASLQPNYCFILRSDGTSWWIQNTQHITNPIIDDGSVQTIGGNKTFSSVLNINGGVIYKNIAVAANNTIGDSSWYGSTIDISSSATWTTTLPTATNNTNMYIWNHSAVNQTINAFLGEGFFGYNVTNNSTSVNIPAYSMIAIRSTSTYTTKTWYVQAYIREGSFFMDNYSNQSFSGTKTFTGSSNFGTSTTDIMTVNAISNLKGGFYTTSLNYFSKTSDYNLWSNNHITFSAVGDITQANPQLLPSIPNGRNVCFSILNNTSNTLYVGSQNGSIIYGKVSPTGALIIPLVGNKTYDFSVANIGQAFGVWIVKATHTAYEEVDIGTDQTIGGNKTFSQTLVAPGIRITNSVDFKKIVLYNNSSDLNRFTSFYGFGIAPSTLTYNVDGTNSNHIFYCADTADSAAIGYIELMRIGNVGIIANKNITINTGFRLITPSITLGTSDLGTTISLLPTFSGINVWTGTSNTFTNAVTALAFNVTSDYRIKEDVYSLHIIPDEFTVDKLRPISYYNNQTKKRDIGLIAHELQEEYPFLVNGEKDGENYQSVNYNGLIGILIKEIQELKSRVLELEKKK